MYKKITIIVAVIALLGIYVIWGMDYIYALTFDKSAPERDMLEEELENTLTILEKHTPLDETLEPRLEQARLELETASEKVTTSADIPELVDNMLRLADEIGIDIIPLHTATWLRANRPGYEVYQIQILVSGDASAITSYIDLLEETGPASIIVSDLQIQGISIGRTDQAYFVEGSLTVSVYKRIEPGAQES